MIVRTLGDSLLLITQPDHAHLAGKVMARATALAQHPRRDAILLAIREHDNGWAEPDAEPIIGSSGDVADFIAAPVAVRQGVWPRAVQHLASESWAAALVAQHAITVYDRFRSDDAWTQFFTDMTALRDRLLGRGALGLADSLAVYALVRLGDLISLTFCTGWTTAQQNLTGDGDPVRVNAGLVTANTFDVLGAAPLLRQGGVGHEGFQLAAQSISQDDREHRAHRVSPRRNSAD